MNNKYLFILAPGRGGSTLFKKIINKSKNVSDLFINGKHAEGRDIPYINAILKRGPYKSSI